jgi:hypothetical protein
MLDVARPVRPRGFIVLVVLALLLAIVPPALAQEKPMDPEPVATFEEGVVNVSGLTAGGQVIWYSIAREPQGFTTRIVRRHGVETASMDSVVSIKVDEGVPPYSVWLVLDSETGAFSLAAPEETSFREIAYPGQSLVRSPQGRLNRLVHTRPYVELFVARPKVGAWRLAAGEGAAGDEDGMVNGSLRAALETMEPVAQSPPAPEELVAGDVVMVVDPRALEYAAVRLVR